MSPEKQAGLVLALSTLAVVTFYYVVEMARAAPTTAVVAGGNGAMAPAVVPVKAEPPAFDRQLLFPLRGHDRALLRDNFAEVRGKRQHEALDIMAPRGTPVVAVDDGRVVKLFTSAAGGLTVYQFDAEQKYAYYYAHLDDYAKGLSEGMYLKRGDLVGLVGSTGNAPVNAPHLHFTIFELGPERKWWKGRAINPYPYLRQ